MAQLKARYWFKARYSIGEALEELDDDEDDTAPSLPAGRDTEPEDLIPEESAGEGEEIEEPDDSDLDLSDDIALDDLDDLDSFELGDDIE